MREIPIPYLRANQTGIVSAVILAALIHQPLIILFLWVVQLLGLIFGLRANIFVQIAKPFLKKYLATANSESQELSRFNNKLAVGFLSISLVFLALGWSFAGYLVAGMLAIAAFAAICGYCLGCTIYYQYKTFKNRRAVR